MAHDLVTTNIMRKIMIEAIWAQIENETLWMSFTIVKHIPARVWSGRRRWWGGKIYENRIRHVDFEFEREQVAVSLDGNVIKYDHKWDLVFGDYRGYIEGISIYLQENGGERLILAPGRLNTRCITPGSSVVLQGGTIDIG